MHTWTGQLQALLPTVRVARVRVLALCALLARQQGQELLLVCDPTNQTERATVAVLGLVVHQRAWPPRMQQVARTVGQQVAAVLPGDGGLTLGAERGMPARTANGAAGT